MVKYLENPNTNNTILIQAPSPIHSPEISPESPFQNPSKRMEFQLPLIIVSAHLTSSRYSARELGRCSE